MIPNVPRSRRPFRLVLMALLVQSPGAVRVRDHPALGGCRNACLRTLWKFILHTADRWTMLKGRVSEVFAVLNVFHVLELCALCVDTTEVDPSDDRLHFR